jgi:hypothetical protein
MVIWSFTLNATVVALTGNDVAPALILLVRRDRLPTRESLSMPVDARLYANGSV